MTSREQFYEFMICLLLVSLIGGMLALSQWIGYERGFREGLRECQYEQKIGQYMHKDIWPGREK